MKSVPFDTESVVKLWIGPRLLVFLYDPRDTELILSSHVHIDKADEYRFFKPWLGNGLLISTGKALYAHCHDYMRFVERMILQLMLKRLSPL